MFMKKIILLISSFLILTGLNAQWATSGTNIYNTNSGNVGIKTSSPQAPLDIVGGNGARFLL